MKPLKVQHRHGGPYKGQRETKHRSFSGFFGQACLWGLLLLPTNLVFAFQQPPGSGPFEDELLSQFENRRKELDSAYRPRTKHLDQSGWAKYTNRLFLESSPYLLQHAHNPVNWYPWGDEAFEEARKTGRPVLLSVGYSTCHWCHVMEEESFEDVEIARYLNQNYIAVKVDREERPDVDGIYMTAVQAITRGRGGWPMTVWLTPDRKPFHGATYIPARDGDRGASMGFLTVLQRLKQIYDTQPKQVLEAGDQIAKVLAERLAPAPGGELPGAAPMDAAAAYYRQRFDAVEGGLTGAPKFPSSLPVRFLLRYYRRSGDKAFLNMALLTLRKMARGGIYDQVAGGFHRYATDAHWLVPHFEKMLYDNALLVPAYLEAFQLSGDRELRRIAREILDYVARDMTSPRGAFFSATDADSLTPEGHREEGFYFTWTPAELVAALGPNQAEIFQKYYGITEKGNFEGRNILHRKGSREEAARNMNLDLAVLTSHIETGRKQLYELRNKRPLPIRDEKILAAWNGLMITAFARGGFVLSRPDYVARAERAAGFVWEHMIVKGQLRRSYKDGKARFTAYLDDYAFVTAAFLDLYEVTGQVRWLKRALHLDRSLETQYEDRERGGFFMTAHEAEPLLAREKPFYDGAIPSGNAVAMLNLARLERFTGKDRFRVRLEQAQKAFSGLLKRSPMACSTMLLALDFYLDRKTEIVIVFPKPPNRKTDAFLKILQDRFLPNTILVSATAGADVKKQSGFTPLLVGKLAKEGKTTAYVCENGTCDLPTTDPAVFVRQIENQSRVPGSPK